MHPADKGGGAGDGVDDGVGGAGGGDGVPEMWATVSDDPISPFGGYINLLLSNGDGAGTMPSGSIGGGAPATMPTDLEVLRRTSGLEFFEEVQLGDIWSTPSVNQPASVPIHGLDGQVDDFLDEGCGDDVVDNESDHYDELLVRCEGDTDVEELYPTRAEAIVQDVMSKAEMMKEARVKKAKHKADKSRAAKRRALEGDVEEEGMTFGDQVSDDCKELTDSSDDDQVVDGNDISLITKKRNRSKKAFKRAYYDESRLNAHDQFQINMCFEDVHQFRRALLNYHVVHQRDWEFLRNDKDRITVCCKSEGPCPFVVMTSTLSGETTHVIRQLILPHTCGKVYTSSRINSVWLSKTYEDQIRSEPNGKITSFMDMVKMDYGISISKHMAYRARHKALVEINGHHEHQYYRVRDYLQTVLNTNPGRSRCIVNVTVNSDPKKNPRFHGLFYCLHAQVEGFFEGCRPFIGVDGCFLKLGNGFQILAATARDGNNNMFPLAFGIVGKEETSTWCWFLLQLRYALGGSGNRYGSFTIMFDHQKGLLNAVKQVFPECEQRFCLRHILANFQLARFRGGDLKKIVDSAAYAFTLSEHLTAMNKLKDESIDAWKWLSKIPTKHWARHAMDTICKTDLVVNNISEIFNSYILDQRDKPVVTMMEQIRTKLMAMFAVRRDGVAVAQWEITPHYVEKLETEKRFARWYTPVNAGNGIWQVETCAVNLLNKTCSCRKWDLIGVPCKHAIAVIHMVKEFPEDHVSDFLKGQCMS